MLAVNWQAGGGEIGEREREREKESGDERGKKEEGRVSACGREGENQRKRGRAQTQAAHTHPLLSPQSGRGVQEAACVVYVLQCVCVCVYRVKRCAGVRERRLTDARIPLFAPGEDTC